MRIQRQLKCPRVAACYARGGGVLAIEPRKVISSARGPVWRRLRSAVVAAGCPDPENDWCLDLVGSPPPGSSVGPNAAMGCSGSPPDTGDIDLTVTPSSAPRGRS